MSVITGAVAAAMGGVPRTECRAKEGEDPEPSSADASSPANRSRDPIHVLHAGSLSGVTGLIYYVSEDRRHGLSPPN